MYPHDSQELLQFQFKSHTCEMTQPEEVLYQHLVTLVLSYKQKSLLSLNSILTLKDAVHQIDFQASQHLTTSCFLLIKLP